MNRYFANHEGRDFPRRSYAKIDQIEPPNAEGDRVVIAFDALDAEWEGLTKVGLLSLEEEDHAMLSEFWTRRFADGPTDELDPFDELPLYRIELTLDRKSPWLKTLSLNEEDWFDIELDKTGEIEVDVFPAIFALPVGAYMSHPPRRSAMSAALNRVFDSNLWPDASATALDQVLNVGCKLDALVSLDVGQGSAIALYCPHGALYYFDVGCGTHGNAKTRPATLQYCDCVTPPIILSHWDSDHWAGAIVDKKLQNLKWIVPRQHGLPAGHITFANDILKAGGNILVLPALLSPFNWSNGQQDFTLLKCTGSTRNGSGLALVVAENRTNKSWLLTGDAGYNEIPPPLPADLVALTVPHHGADMTHLGSAPSASVQTYRRAVYSFGPGNSFGRTRVRHPVAAAVADHNSRGWTQGSWAGVVSPAFTLAGGDVLATAEHLSTHNGGTAVGFTAPPVLPLAHSSTCTKPLPITQT